MVLIGVLDGWNSVPDRLSSVSACATDWKNRSVDKVASKACLDALRLLVSSDPKESWNEVCLTADLFEFIVEIICKHDLKIRVDRLKELLDYLFKKVSLLEIEKKLTFLFNNTRFIDYAINNIEPHSLSLLI